jgi:D-glycero-alpha-D-manno-heptose-7-phosphate kinase
MKIVSRAPCRVDLAGGTLDIWPLYLYHSNPVTLNIAVDRYASCELETRPDARIVLRSRDLGAEETFDCLEALRAARNLALPLLARVACFFSPTRGFQITTDSEAPAGAGLAGSSSLIIAVAGALNRLTGAGYKSPQMREISQNLEAQLIGVPTGTQDYYPALFGGVSAIELSTAGVTRKPVPVDFADLNRRMVLAYTGVPRNSGINNWEVMKAHIDGNKAVQRNFDRIAATANSMRAALEQGDWVEAGRLLRTEWAHRRRNAPGISTPLIDTLVRATARAGAIGAKVCGAGGGGCVLFLVEPDAKSRVEAVIVREGGVVLPARVAPRGLQMRKG